MIFGLLLRPGVWLLRRMRFAGKLVLLAGVSSMASVVAGYQLFSSGSLASSPVNLLMANAIGLLLTFYFLLALHRSVAQDLRRMTLTLSNMVAGDLRPDLGEQGSDELGSLGIALGKLGNTL
ncbi:MAG: Chemotaxis protein [Polaromonas sp.]|nr:Chemotaxis protein [Polaromonas sp.]